MIFCQFIQYVSPGWDLAHWQRRAADLGLLGLQLSSPWRPVAETSSNQRPNSDFTMADRHLNNLKLQKRLQLYNLQLQPSTAASTLQLQIFTSSWNFSSATSAVTSAAASDLQLQLQLWICDCGAAKSTKLHLQAAIWNLQLQQFIIAGSSVSSGSDIHQAGLLVVVAHVNCAQSSHFYC